MQQGHVLYTFCANKPEQLSIIKGDKVVILEASLSRIWWLVERQDKKRGLCPGSYIIPDDPCALEHNVPPPYMPEKESGHSNVSLDGDLPPSYEQSDDNDDGPSSSHALDNVNNNSMPSLPHLSSFNMKRGSSVGDVRKPSSKGGLAEAGKKFLNKNTLGRSGSGSVKRGKDSSLSSSTSASTSGDELMPLAPSESPNVIVSPKPKTRPSFSSAIGTAGGLPPAFGLDSTRALNIEMIYGKKLVVKDHKIKNGKQTIRHCFKVQEANEWLMRHLNTKNMETVTTSLNEMIEAGFIIELDKSEKILRFADDDELIKIIKQMKNEMKCKDRQYKFQTMKSCFVGTEAVRWMNRYNDASDNNVQALRMLTRALNIGSIVCCNDLQPTFMNDETLYKFAPSVDNETTKGESTIPTGVPLKLDSTSMARAIAVKSSWKQLIQEKEGEIFPMKEISSSLHNSLYRYCPEAKIVLPDDLGIQSRALGYTLRSLVGSSDTVDKTFLKNVGKHHRELGVTKDMYIGFGKALLDLVNTRLKVNANIHNAWVYWYSFIVTLILKGANDDHKSFKSEFEKKMLKG